ncbi:hypothetical protein GMA19_02578 [Paenibacillus polymyxa E681]|uniref:hypothetical protein n=1 Tax=Paenibacillus polymyxa TaxID=1406 RepID=UPI0001E31E4A|nr:hypothetical protein [Paenibacillus polymyxa]ADM70379.1 hypothetical protein PPE_02550 [Paenibacillus polymyxa E681]QNV57408.1 hypothetical protein GE561_02578 [Paenibacillus polymyxa E681]QNV62245.1 hypothetical protein GMA19_02578 [Paenibacillus polymyxa E681]
MSTILFWSPIKGASGSSSLATAIAITIGNLYRGRLLLTHLGRRYTGIESGLPIQEYGMDDPTLQLQEGGWDAAARLVLRGTLSKENIRNYTTPVLEHTLDVLEGTSSFGAAPPLLSPGLVRAVIDTANQYYDLTLIDAGSGVGWGAVQHEACARAKLAVLSLTQNMRELDAYFESVSPLSTYSSLPLLIVLGKYDVHSQVNETNIRRRYSYKGALYTVPYSTGFMDAWNRRDVIGHVQREVRSRKEQHRKLFMPVRWAQSIRHISKAILEAAESDLRLKALERGA